MRKLHGSSQAGAFSGGPNLRGRRGPRVPPAVRDADFGELTPKLAEPHDRIRTKATISDVSNLVVASVEELNQTKTMPERVSEHRNLAPCFSADCLLDHGARRLSA
jgi:hypothetical protein